METLDPNTKQKIEDQIKNNRIFLYMKGDRNFPHCGFSARVVEILEQLGVNYETYDILEDPEMRQSLKIYSNWPTFPQLYVGGQLVGGCDIVTELFESGELQKIVGQER